MSRKIINDRIFLSDRFNASNIHMAKKSTLWAGTEIIAGYDLQRDPVTGTTSWGEVLFDKEPNTVVIGGVQYAMEQIFGVKGPIVVPTLYDQLGIGLPNSSGGSGVPTPGGTRTMPYKYGNTCILYGVGITNNAQNVITKYDVGYRENSIQMTKVAADGTNLQGVMLPFRYTAQPLSDIEALSYFGKKETDGYQGYYLKKFENDPFIRNLWDTGAGDDSEEEVTNSEVYTSTRTTPVITVTEMELKISTKDIKEFYEATGRVDEPAVNTIALFYADYNNTLGDYENVRMFSKLSIPSEPLSLAKDLDLLYKVYGS